MGQKVHPVGLRLGIIYEWDSKWYAKNTYTDDLHEDLSIRKYIQATMKRSGVSKVKIERSGQKMRVIIHAARPGIIIGRGGQEVERLRKKLQTMTKCSLQLDINEIKEPELEARLVAQNIATQLEKRISFRRAMKQSVTNILRRGAEGVKITCAGRLGGAEIARTEWYREGRVPLHTLRANIDYGVAEAVTTYGLIGIKVWVYKGEVLPEKEKIT